MKTFLKWAEENEFDLPMITDAPEGEKATKENTKRTGMTDNYPDAYSKGQYCPAYMPPIKGTAFLDLKQKASKSYGGQKAAN
jgi:hypothetical protein